MKKIFSLPITVILICGLTWACKKEGTPPTLPPAQSMTIDFSNFLAGKKSEQVNYSLGAVENTNWTVAATVAGVWNSILVINLAIPVASFQKAMNTTPTNLSKTTWQWKYSVDVVGVTYTARLTGQIASNNIKWQMYISKQGANGYVEFLWYEGTTALDGNSGTWTINTSQADQTPMLKIDWSKSGTAIDSIKYTYIKTGQAFNGSYIQYGLTSNALNAFYNVYFWEPNKVKFTTVNIEWSTSVHNGHIKAPDYFLDSNWYCWDGNGNDVTCPAR